MPTVNRTRLKEILMWVSFAIFWGSGVTLSIQVSHHGDIMSLVSTAIIGATAIVSAHLCHDIHMDDRLPKISAASDSSDWE